MNKLEIGTITDYMKEWNDLQEETPDFRTEDRFWHYVAGREHKKKPYPPLTPVKATWELCTHEMVYAPTGKCRLCGKKVADTFTEKNGEANEA